MQAAIQQPGHHINPDLVHRRPMPGAPRRVRQQVDALHRRLGLGRGQPAGRQHRSPGVVQPRAHAAVAQRFAVAPLVMRRVDTGDHPAQPHRQLPRGQTTSDSHQPGTHHRDLRGGEPAAVLGEHPHLGPVDLPGQKRRVHRGQLEHHLLSEIGFGVRGPARPRQRRAHLIGRMQIRVREPVDRGVVNGRPGPPHLGQHPQHPSGLVRGLPRLRSQQLGQVVVRHPRRIDRSERGAQRRPRREPRQRLHRIRHRYCHEENIRSTPDSSRMPAMSGRLQPTKALLHVGRRIGQSPQLGHEPLAVAVEARHPCKWAPPRDKSSADQVHERHEREAISAGKRCGSGRHDRPSIG